MSAKELCACECNAYVYVCMCECVIVGRNYLFMLSLTAFIETLEEHGK